MARYFIELAYNGTRFHGWQTQPNAETVQETLDHALSTLLRQPIETTGCGRTDTGVHASQFFAHFDTESAFIQSELIFRLNALCGRDIIIYNLQKVHDEAHARFDATLRSYSYYLSRQKPLFQQELMWFNHQPLDIERMNKAASFLLSHTDFSCFSKSGGQQHTNNCSLSEARWIDNGSHLRLTITSNRFLRGMVRAVTGTLLQVGGNEITPEQFHAILQSGDRTKAGPSVPARGLFLEEIRYPYIASKRRFPFEI